MNTKTIIVSGSRGITDYRFIKEAIESSPWFGAIDHVFVGDAKGVDSLVVQWCKENGIGYTIFKADWKAYGRGAGPLRNSEMVHSGGQALVAVWDGESRGTKNMIALARKNNLPVYVKIVDYVDQKIAQREEA